MQKYKAPSFDDYNKVISSLDKPKISKPIMTKYEFDQFISLRANRKIALKELQEGKLPYIVKRPLPNNKFEYYRIGDLDLTAVQYMMR
jgi:hypothetical protein